VVIRSVHFGSNALCRRNDASSLEITLPKFERVDLTIAGEIVAISRRGSKRQSIPILDLPLQKPPPAGAEWIEAYRMWAKGA